jgi:hypothetical protein
MLPTNVVPERSHSPVISIAAATDLQATVDSDVDRFLIDLDTLFDHSP